MEVMTKQEYKDKMRKLAEMIEMVDADLEWLDGGHLYKRQDNGFFKDAGPIENNLWTAQQVRAYLTDQAAEIYGAMELLKRKFHDETPGCERDWFCDGCPIMDDCDKEKIFEKDAIEGVHYIKGKEVPKQQHLTGAV